MSVGRDCEKASGFASAMMEVLLFVVWNILKNLYHPSAFLNRFQEFQ